MRTSVSPVSRVPIILLSTLIVLGFVLIMTGERYFQAVGVALLLLSLFAPSLRISAGREREENPEQETNVPNRTMESPGQPGKPVADQLAIDLSGDRELRRERRRDALHLLSGDVPSHHQESFGASVEPEGAGESDVSEQREPTLAPASTHEELVVRQNSILRPSAFERRADVGPLRRIPLKKKIEVKKEESTNDERGIVLSKGARTAIIRRRGGSELFRRELMNYIKRRERDHTDQSS